MADQERLDEIERDWAHVHATGGAVDLEECGTCSEAFAAVPWLLAELRAAREELEHWRSGRRRKSWPVVEAVPDGLHYAAELARAQGTEGGEAHDELLRSAAMRLKRLHDTGGSLLAERDALAARLEAVTAALLMGGQNAGIRCRAALRALDDEAVTGGE